MDWLATWRDGWHHVDGSDVERGVVGWPVFLAAQLVRGFEKVTAADKAAVGRPRTFDRERVIETAVESYWRDGVDGVSLNEICRRAGVSKPGVYREFGGEDGLMDAALEYYAATVLAPNFEKATHDRLLRDVLADMVNLMTDTDRGGPAGCLLAKMQQSPERLGPVVRTRVEALRAGARGAYADWVDQAKQRGEVPISVSTTVAAGLIDTQCTTLLVLMAHGEDPEMLRAQATLAFTGLTGTGGSATPLH